MNVKKRQIVSRTQFVGLASIAKLYQKIPPQRCIMFFMYVLDVLAVVVVGPVEGLGRRRFFLLWTRRSRLKVSVAARGVARVGEGG